MTLQEGNSGSQYIVEQLDLPVDLERRLEALGDVYKRQEQSPPGPDCLYPHLQRQI